MPGGVMRFGFITLFAAAIFLIGVPCQSRADSNKVLARVNGVEILQWQIDLIQSLLFGNQDSHLYTRSQVLRDEILKYTIDMEVIYQDSLKRGLAADEHLVERFLWNYKASFPSLSAFREALESMGVTDENFSSMARKLVVMGKCQEEQGGQHLVPTDEEAREYYENNPQDFLLPQAIRIRHILVRITPENGVGRESALARAQEIMARVKTGKEPFAVIAREVSDGPEKEQGGDLGYVSEGALDTTELAPLEEVILSLKAGEVGPMVETPIGFHIVKALDARPESITSFETIKDKLINTLYKRRFVEALNKMAAALKSDYCIEMIANP